MNWRSSTMMILGTMVVAGCSFGPRFDAAMPQVRSVPVLADLTPAQSLVQGRTYLAARQYGLAIELFKTAARDPVQRADSLNGLAVAYDGIGRADLAERYFQEALAARPGDPRLRANLARFYAVSGQSDKRRDLLAAVDRLTSPAQMGELFKVALLVPQGVGLPPGFETDFLTGINSDAGTDGSA